MPLLYTLAYPRLAQADAARLEGVRRAHDPQAGLVAAHFTLVFGCAGVDHEAYLAHVGAVAASSRCVPVACRHAMLGTDDSATRAYAWLVPDEGASGLARLHDRLYRGPLAAMLRLDVPFVPHVTLGMSPDFAAMKRLCDALNDEGLDVAGTVDALTVASLEGGALRPVAEFALR
jgi:2'-5' RNA ligase